MSAETITRKLERAFKPAVVAAAAAEFGAGAVSVRLRHEERTGAAQPLPAIILAATFRGNYEAVRVAGRIASELELSAICRADGNADESAATIERLASIASAAIQNPGALEGWLYLHIVPKPADPATEGETRVDPTVWRVFALNAV